MNPALRIGYAAAAQLARAAAAVVPAGGSSKVSRALHARRGIRERFAAWGRTGRDPARPLLWVHAPSVGEGLQARPVLELFRRERPDVQLAYTHYSPSAEAFAASLDVDFADYLPFDTGGDADAALSALRPSALVFSKLDVWPTLAEHAAARRVALGLVSATLSGESSRRSGLAAALLRDAYRGLDAIGAIDEEDAARLAELGARREAITVTGDTRYDQVWARAESAPSRAAELLAPLRSSRPTLVAGSTWPADEGPLLDGWRAVRARVGDARLVIAPHEPTPAHLAPIERWASDAGLSLARLGDRARAADADVVLVDRVGVLGDLYALADAAFVGGGFHAAGLHSVLEPAAFGAPVLFGPRFTGSRDARLLLAAAGGATATASSDLAEVLARWLGDPAARRAAGDAAKAVVQHGLGAARRSYDLVAGLVDATGKR
ncbi:MAG TPA: glycosyltransferase N-terminal domain-containing protein [Gemmatimonadaceae bacterium]|nr:glycosyltransferase N-terminal domain-containing protein [Gemmatimonadaceae bacterium]